MQIEQYPAQEPFTDIGARYHAEVMQRADGTQGREVQHGDNPYQSLMVFPAQQPVGDVLCMMHGGGWTNGYKEWMSFMAPALNARGVTFVSLGYRLAPTHVFPAGFEDCLDGMAWVYENIAEHGGDPERIFVSGHSAGGHYASLAALRQDWQQARQVPVNVVKGALPISGTYYFGADSGLSMRPRFLGAEQGDREAAATPMNFIHGGAPAFLVAHGEKDFPHLVRQAGTFVRALADNDVSAALLELADCDHLGASYASGDAGGSWIEKAVEFMHADNKQ